MISYIIGTIKNIKKIDSNNLSLIIQDYNNERHTLLYKINKEDDFYRSGFKTEDNVSIIIDDSHIINMFYTNKILNKESQLARYDTVPKLLKRIIFMFLFFQVIFLLPFLLINPNVFTTMSISEYYASVLLGVFYFSCFLSVLNSIALIKDNIKAKKYSLILNSFLSDHENMKI